MARSLTDRIEQYIKTLIERSDNKQIEIQRMELAETFSCVPSQVTYVVSTRFGPESGYVTESRRGGSGYVRISKIEFYAVDSEESLANLWIAGLCQQKHLTKREALLVRCFYRQALEGLSLPTDKKLELLKNSIDQFLKMQEGSRA